MSDAMINNKIYSNLDKTMSIASSEAKDVKSSSDCIWNKEGQNNSNNEVNQRVSSEIDKILAEICKKYEKYGLTVEQLKQNPAIQYVCHAKEENLAKMPQDKKENAIKMYKEALDAAIKDSIKNGKIDIKNVAKLSNDYFIALATDWSIDGFKEAQNKPGVKHSLMQRLIASGCLPKNATIKNTSPEKLKVAVEKFYKKVLANDIKTLRYKKTENGHKEGELLSQEDKAKTQLQTLKTSGYNIITMLTGISNSDQVPVTRTDSKTYGNIIEEIFGTKDNPTAGKFYNIQDSEIEKTITQDIYKDLMPISKELKDITITDYFPKEIVDNFDFAYVSKANIGTISTEINKQNNSITWTIPQLKSGETATVQYTLKLKQDFDSSIVGKILITNEKVDLSYTDFNDKKIDTTSDVSPKLKLTEPPVTLPKAGIKVMTILFASLSVLAIYYLVRFNITKNNMK